LPVPLACGTGSRHLGLCGLAEPGERAFHHLPGSHATAGELGGVVSEWIARVYKTGKFYRVVVEGVLQFDVSDLERVEEKTAKALLDRVRTSYPPRGKPWEDPTAERVMEFEVAVHLASLAGDSD
jgi:hypothetical protein